MFSPEELYQAYGNSADWKNYQGFPMPAWEELPENIIKHWTAVADFVNVSLIS